MQPIERIIKPIKDSVSGAKEQHEKLEMFGASPLQSGQWRHQHHAILQSGLLQFHAPVSVSTLSISCIPAVTNMYQKTNESTPDPTTRKASEALPPIIESGSHQNYDRCLNLVVVFHVDLFFTKQCHLCHWLIILAGGIDWNLTLNVSYTLLYMIDTI